MKESVIYFFLLCLVSFSEILSSVHTFEHDEFHDDPPDSESRTIKKDDEPQVPEGCLLVMAESTIPNSGWGVFSLKGQFRGQTLPYAEDNIVIHITDPHPVYAAGMRRLIWEYVWDGQEVGGQYEGQRVMSLAPGLGMLGNGQATEYNVKLQRPSTNNAGLDRNSPGAGAISNYYNLTWKVQKDLEPGSELFVNSGEGWFKERGLEAKSETVGTRSVDWLRQHGYCLDNLYSGPSTIPNAGRGAFARRNFEEARVIAPIPVILLKTDSLRMAKQHESGRVVMSDQLLRNYCFGHRNSSILIYPYSPMINLVNHASSGNEANVKLQWSASSVNLFDAALQDPQSNSSGLLMELVAVRPIQAGEEMFLDYGKEWVQEWERHVQTWSESESSDSDEYVSSQSANADMDNTVLRTVMELQSNPYPDNLFTSCYYRYSLDWEAVGPSNSRKLSTWKDSPGLTSESRNLRPCIIMDRRPTDNGEMLYTVRMLNRPGLVPAERIPKGEPCLVAAVPRYAIEFSDKLYTTNQHLEHSFRKEIGLDVFPNQWKDLFD